MAEELRTGPAWQTVTRRLSAGAYLDPGFRRQVLREIYQEGRRWVAPSYGYDLVSVLRHAWRAWWLETGRDVLAAALVLGALVIAPLAALLLVGVLGVVGGMRVPVPDGGAGLGGGLAVTWWVRRSGAGYRLFGAVLVICGALLAMRHAPGGWPMRGGLPGTALLFSAVVLVYATTGVLRGRELRRLAAPARGVAGRPVRGRRLRAVQAQQVAPLTVYSGRRPSVGSGQAVRSWSFALTLAGRSGASRPPAVAAGGLPFGAGELIRHSRAALAGLGSIVAGGAALPGLLVRDHVFVPGTEVALVRELSAGPLRADTTDRLAAQPDAVARHYLACQLVAGDGELVTTAFAGALVRGPVLYLEFAAHALLPGAPGVVDPAGGGSGTTGQAAAQGVRELPELLSTPARLVAVPGDLLRGLLAWWGRPRSRSGDIGARVSARELAAGRPDRPVAADAGATVPFQLLGCQVKIIERRFLAAVGEFLIRHRLDTVEFARQAGAILDNGLIDTGAGQIDISDGGGWPVAGAPAPAG